MSATWFTTTIPLQNYLKLRTMCARMACSEFLLHHCYMLPLVHAISNRIPLPRPSIHMLQTLCAIRTMCILPLSHCHNLISCGTHGLRCNSTQLTTLRL